MEETASGRREGIYEHIRVFLRDSSIFRESSNEKARMVFGVQADPIWRHSSEGDAEEAEIVVSCHVGGLERSLQVGGCVRLRIQ